MKCKHVLATVIIAATTLVQAPAFSASEFCCILYYPGKKAVALTPDAEGKFTVNGLRAGRYRVCLTNKSSCAETDVGKDGSISGRFIVDKKRAKKHNYVGHVTLLR
jgi:hypothetical protein